MNNNDTLQRIKLMKENDYILRLPEVIRRTGLSRSSIYSLISTDQFPHQINLSTRSVGWLNSEIDTWLLDKLQRRSVAS
jgi:prophage regulatory protein